VARFSGALIRVAARAADAVAVADAAMEVTGAPFRVVPLAAGRPGDAISRTAPLVGPAVGVQPTAAAAIGLAELDSGIAADRLALRGLAAHRLAARTRLSSDRGVDTVVVPTGAPLTRLDGAVGHLAAFSIDAGIAAADLAVVAGALLAVGAAVPGDASPTAADLIVVARVGGIAGGQQAVPRSQPELFSPVSVFVRQ